MQIRNSKWITGGNVAVDKTETKNRRKNKIRKKLKTMKIRRDCRCGNDIKYIHFIMEFMNLSILFSLFIIGFPVPPKVS